MVIDFKYTEEHNSVITYFNVRGQAVKTYNLSQITDYVNDNKLNLSYEHDSEGGTGMVSDPNTNFNENEILYDIHDYIDENWAKVTQDFYNAMNPNEYKSQNKPQQTKEAV